MSSSVEEKSACCCSGIRFCAHCKDSERVRMLFDGKTTLKNSETVISNQQAAGRTSSCSFGLIGSSTHSYCFECRTLIQFPGLLRRCADHTGYSPSAVKLNGFFVESDIINEEQELNLINFLDSPVPFEGWKDSQSGRRKQDYGPRGNFKKKKVKPAHMPHMPMAFQAMNRKIEEAVKKYTHSEYRIADVNVLEYTAANFSNFDPHVDDTWLWGDRIAGLNLLEDCAMTFVNKDNVVVEAFFPRRCFFLMSGECRYSWMHAIRPENVHNRRISVTFRELSPEIMEDSSVADPILRAACDYI